MGRSLYDHGLPFSTKLAENIDDGLIRVDKNKATCIVIDGGVGEGKTTLAIHISDYINKKRGLPELVLDAKDHPQLAMGGKQFAKQMRECFMKSLPVIVYDEGGDYSKRGAMTQFNAFLTRIFETYRAFKIVVIICLPNMNVLDNSLFDNRIPRMILHCHGRDENDGDIKGYSLHRAFYLRYHMKRYEDKNFAYQIVEPNFVGHFLNLPDARSEKLNKLSISGKLDILESAELKLDGLIGVKELGNRMAKSHSWVIIVLKKLKIKPIKYIKRLAYYPDTTLEILQDFVANGGSTYVKKEKKLDEQFD